MSTRPYSRKASSALARVWLATRLGEMDTKDLKETTMDPATRALIRMTIDEDEPGETGDLVERLMGKKAELRFQYVQENARFVEGLDV